MLQSWRWFGDSDPVPLSHIKQAGVDGIVSALHHIPNGEIWDVDSINTHKDKIAKYHMQWVVVESIPVHEDIKTRSGPYATYIDNYKQTLRNLAHCGLKTVCYNFMPVVDWTRTDLSYPMADGATALRFDVDRFGVFDIYLLKRKGAEADYDKDALSRIETLYNSMSQDDKDQLTSNIIAGLPGSESSYGIADIAKQIACYEGMTADDLRKNLRLFLQDIMPTAIDVGINMCIHPDDPPRPLLGLPRVVSTADDIRYIFESVDTIHNGLTFCTGSLGVRADNDLLGIVGEFAPRIHFAHLRAPKREANPLSFHEAPHLDGDVPMVHVIDALLAEQFRRQHTGRTDSPIAFRPDHGHQMLDDLSKQTNPGYSAIGRLRGLAELRGIIHTLQTVKDYTTA